MAALAMGLALAVALPLTGCGDDAGGGTGGAGGSDASSSSGDATSSSAVSTYGTPTSVGSSSGGDGGGGVGGDGGGGGGGGGACIDEPFFEDPTCDSCAQESCCSEIEACFADPDNCADAEGFIDPASSLGEPLLACLETECSEQCNGS